MATAGRVILFVFQIQQVIIDMLFSDFHRTRLIMHDKPGDSIQVGPFGVIGKILQIHCPDHLLTQLCHRIPPLFGVNKLGGILHDQSN